ncbi:MAG TPA: hypothetical protein VLG10_03415 [Methylomirabilota bacterium]|nr:hypothetical protein [Methylomirabilota bacterium]
MKRWMAVIPGILVAVAPVVASAQQCPPEVDQAKKMLSTVVSAQKAAQAPRQLAGARGQDAQAPRGQDAQAPRGQGAQAPRGQDAQAPRGQDAQAPRGQDAQAPRGQDAQAPRGQDAQAPRGQDAQAPRGQDAQAPRAAASAPSAPDRSKTNAVTNARKLIQQAELACKQKDSAQASAYANAAMALLTYAK